MIQWTASEQINELGQILHIYRHPGENVLAAAYLQFQKEGLLDIVWHMRPITLSQFLESAKNPANCFYACFSQKIGDADDQVRLSGMGWAWDSIELAPGSNRCEVGMSFFREFQDRRMSKAFCEMMIDDGFCNLSVETMLGFSPVENQAACLFHIGMGFKLCAEIPGYTTWQGKVTACRVSVLTKEMWNQAKVKSEAA